MRLATLGSAVVTVLLLLTTMVCGLWISANEVTDPGSLDFHRTSAFASVAASMVTLTLVATLLVRQRTRR